MELRCACTYVISLIKEIFYTPSIPKNSRSSSHNRVPPIFLLPAAFAIKQKPLEIEFTRKAKRGTIVRLLDSPHFASSLLFSSSSYPPSDFSGERRRGSHSRTNLSSNRNARANGGGSKSTDLKEGWILENANQTSPEVTSTRGNKEE